MSLNDSITIEISPRLEVTAPMFDAYCVRLEERLTTLLADAIAAGYTIEVSQRMNPLAPREAVTVASLRRARGNY